MYILAARLVAIGIAILAMSASSSARAPMDLTAGLAPGPYAVGFHVLYKHDASRTWKTTRSRGLPFTPDTAGRPVRIEMWYPAIAAKSGAPMRYADYITLPAPKEFADAEPILEEREHLIATLSVPESKLDALLATRVTAHMNAPAASGKFPLLIHFPGLNDAQAINEFVMAEFLASHGYVVAAVSLLGTSDVDTDQHRTPIGIETTVRDAEFAYGFLRNEPMVDSTKLAVSGHSLGAIDAVLFAMRNANTSAAIGLDGTYGFAGATEVLTKFYSYSPQRMTAALLDLRKNAGQQQTVFDLSALNEMHFSERTLISVDQMHHSDFTSFAVVGYEFGMPSTYTPAGGEHFWSRESGYHGYVNACEIVLDYLDAVLKHNQTADARLRADVGRAKDGTFERLVAAEIPPTPEELVELAEKQGYEAATSLVARYLKGLPVDWVVDESKFNSLGYSLLGAKNVSGAIIAFRLNTYAHPQSSNAFDSLADGYIAAKDIPNAITTYEQAIKAAATDSSLNDASRQGFITDETSKIEKLKQHK